MMNIFTVIFLLSVSLITSTAGFAAELISLNDATLIDNPSNDGDSFFVSVNGEELHMRLYFVDCMETNFSSKAEVDRIIEQRRHFGLPNTHAVVRFGQAATAYVKQVLAEPFTIFTSYASSPGRGTRIYGFIKTSDGEYLSQKLVRAGLARIHGTTRMNPEGIPSDITLRRLQDLKDLALLNHAGIWQESDPGMLFSLREEQRQEEQALRNLKREISGIPDRGGEPLDLNSANSLELQTIKGIGPVMAEKIIAARPYKSINDLLKVHGIGPAKLKDIAPHVMLVH